jgi:hypothetical protein
MTSCERKLGAGGRGGGGHRERTSVRECRGQGQRRAVRRDWSMIDQEGGVWTGGEQEEEERGT